VGSFHLGDPGFPAVVAADAQIKERLRSDPLWADYGQIVSSSGLTVSHGFLDEDGSIVPTTITGDYDILVNPRGVSGWTGGAPESILEPFWVAAQFYGAYTPDALRLRTRDFYRRFYRHELTEAQLAMILT
jgi:hypothetical protein